MFAGVVNGFVRILSLAFVLYQIVLPVYAFMPNMKERAIHLAFALTIIFLGGARKRNAAGWAVDFTLSALGVGLCLYVFFAYRSIIDQYGVATGDLQVWMGLALVLVVLEAARRMVRPTLPIIASLFLLYALFGHLIPGQFGHPPYSLRTIGSMLFLTTGGIWGQLLGVSANIIAIFVFLGAFIVYTGGGTGFMKISLRLAGKYTGGPAKVATISSALFGSISGSASANVASTGAFTIPMMKRLGYRPAFAGAVEAVASTGGQIMPPIMGAGAFIMAELIETSYLTIVLSAAVPAVLYFFSIYIGIHFLSRKERYSRMAPDQIPSWRDTMGASVFFLIPFSILGYWLIRGYTPQYAAFWSVVSTLILAFFNENFSLDVSNVYRKYDSAVQQGARQAAMIASICASAQVIISVIAFTGLGVKLSSNILAYSQSSLFLALVLTGMTSLILGMEVPTTAAYIVAVVVSGPVLMELGVPPISAHLFVFYLAILSAITPPVCGAIFIAAGMADANWLETAKYGLKLCFAAFLIPFLFVYDPSLVFIGSPLYIALGFGRALIAIMLLSAGIMGYFNYLLTPLRRIAVIGAGILLFVPQLWADVAGLFIGAIVWFSAGSKDMRMSEKVSV